jgi:UDP-glucose 4-epimerase
LFAPEERFCWGNEPKLELQIAEAVRAFATQAGTADQWEIFWAAGVGTMSCTEADLRPETQALSVLIHQVSSQSLLMETHGVMVLASSAGAIYAGATDDVITENTLPVPTTAYAREKLRQEDMIRSFAFANSRIAVLIARISTLYGPGQAVGKQQGLIAHIARCVLQNQPIQIYVPFDTIRDYIAADDAAAAMIATLRAMSDRTGVLTKIMASERPTTIAEIVSVFKKLTRHPPRIVTSAARLTGVYSRRIQFRSVAVPKCALPSKTSLLVGIAQVMSAERVAYARGSGLGRI